MEGGGGVEGCGLRRQIPPQGWKQGAGVGCGWGWIESMNLQITVEFWYNIYENNFENLKRTFLSPISHCASKV